MSRPSKARAGRAAASTPRPSLADELLALSRALAERAALAKSRPEWSALDRLQAAASETSRAWSGSSIGYHARVYYADLQAPPPGARFSQEWGSTGIFQGTVGDWREYRHEDVLDLILRRAGDPDTEAIERIASETRKEFESSRSKVQSIFTVALAGRPDAYLESAAKQVNELAPLTLDAAVRVQLPRGTIMTRDRTALGQGVTAAPHQEIFGRIVSARSAVAVIDDLANLAERAADHLRRRGEDAAETDTTTGRVFIGHGRSPLWRELKDFVADRLGLEWDEFNRTPTAGLATKERLQQMLDEAAFALLVLTAEDQRVDGTLVARQNVIHEAGLFQGRLGWQKAIILLEEGCDEFSNIEGLGQIRFPAGGIDASFEQVRAVLEREGMVSARRS